MVVLVVVMLYMVGVFLFLVDDGSSIGAGGSGHVGCCLGWCK